MFRTKVPASKLIPLFVLLFALAPMAFASESPERHRSRSEKSEKSSEVRSKHSRSNRDAGRQDRRRSNDSGRNDRGRRDDRWQNQNRSNSSHGSYDRNRNDRSRDRAGNEHGARYERNDRNRNDRNNRYDRNSRYDRHDRYDRHNRHDRYERQRYYTNRHSNSYWGYRPWNDCNLRNGYYYRTGRYTGWTFDVPRLLLFDYLSRYDEYYYGSVFHAGLGRDVQVYLFPAYYGDRVEYVPYAYDDDGQLYGRGSLISGNLGISIQFNF